MTHITQFSSDELDTYLQAFVDMLRQTVNGGASIGWIPPLSKEESTAYWLTVKEQLTAGNKILLVALQDQHIVGSVQLGLESRENGNHRAEVQKLMVHPDYRRQGIARQLMENVDRHGRDANRSLLVLDVRKGDPAESLYQQMGYTHVGDIPDYARRNATEFDATAYYYKKV